MNNADNYCTVLTKRNETTEAVFGMFENVKSHQNAKKPETLPINSMFYLAERPKSMAASISKYKMIDIWSIEHQVQPRHSFLSLPLNWRCEKFVLVYNWITQWTLCAWCNSMTIQLGISERQTGHFKCFHGHSTHLMVNGQKRNPHKKCSSDCANRAQLDWHRSTKKVRFDVPTISFDLVVR